MSDLDSLAPPASLDDLPPPTGDMFRSTYQSDIEAAQALGGGFTGPAGRALGRLAIGAGEYGLHKAGQFVQGLEAGRGTLPASLQGDQSYQPRTAEGQAITKGAGLVYERTHPAYYLPSGTAPEIGAGLNMAEDLAFGGLFRGDPAYQAGGSLATPTIFSNAPPPRLDTDTQSIGAAAATHSAENASPELRAAIDDARTSGVPVNETAVQRHLNADAQPVPGQLSLGQATGSPVHASNEFNTRGVVPGAPEFYQEQRRNLVDNLRAYRQDVVAPDVHTTETVGHASNVMDGYKEHAAAVDADLAAKYQAYADTRGGTIDQSGFMGRLEARLRSDKTWYTDGAQKVVNSLKQDIEANPNMTVPELEAHQTALARTARTSSDGNEAYAAGLAKEELYNVNPSAGATALELSRARAARDAARADFDAQRADPAYAAARGYNPESPGTSMSPEDFARRFITNGSRDQLALMNRTLADQPLARQSMAAISMEDLRKAAGVGPDWAGEKFNGESFIKKWDNLGNAKRQLLFGPENAERMQGFRDYVEHAQRQPGGGWYNTSGTEVARAAREKGGALAGMAEAAANAKLPLPIVGGAGTVARAIGGPILKGRKAARFYDEHFTPGAGVDYAGSTP